MRTIADIVQAFRTNLSTIGSPLSNFTTYSNIYALVKAFATIVNDQEYQLEVQADDLSLVTAQADALDTIALPYGITRLDGAPSTGYVLASSTSTTTLPNNLLLSNADGSIQFTLSGTYTISTEQAIPITCTINGPIGNLPSGTYLYSNFASGVTFIVGSYRNTLGIPQTSLIGGITPEQDAAFRSRISSTLSSSGRGTIISIKNALTQAGYRNAYVKSSSPVPGYFTVFIDSQYESSRQVINNIVAQVVAAGIGYVVSSLIPVYVDVTINLRVNNLSNSDQVYQDFNSAITGAFSLMDLGTPLSPASITSLALTVPNVVGATVTSPANAIFASQDSLLKLGNLNITLSS